MFDSGRDGGNAFSALMNNYESAQSGVEGAATAEEEASPLMSSLRSSLGGMGDTLASSVGSVRQSGFLKGTPLEGGAVDLEAGTASSAAASAEASFSSFSRSERFKGFVLLLALSLFFFTLASFFLPVAVIVPGKFAFPFSMGSIFFMGAFMLVKGPSAWARSVCGLRQLPFTVAYFASIFGTLYACLVWRSYVMVIVCCAVQLCALGYYAFGNMPGGQYGLQLVARFVRQFMRNVCWPCVKGVFSLASR